MTPEKKKHKISWKKIGLPAAAVIVVAAAGLIYSYLTQQSNVAAQAETDDTFNTARVRQGDLTISASGSGKLAAGQSAQLSFPTSGKVGAVAVQVGDRVAAGQELARLQDISTLQASLTAAELDLELAGQSLAGLETNAAANIVNAQVAVWDAETALATAQYHLKKEGITRCSAETIEAYYAAYETAKNFYARTLEADTGNPYYYLNEIVPAKDEVDAAQSAYERCQGYSEYEIGTSQAELTLAEVSLTQAQAALALLQQYNGIDPTEQAQAQSALANAEIAFALAQQNLDGAVLRAPFDGTVLAVAGTAGDPVGTDTFITVIDLYNPVIEFSVDEADMNKVAIGATAQIVFDALPDQTFSGTVTRLNPNLESVSGYQVLSGVIRMAPEEAAAGQRLLEGLNASVEIISGEAKDALLVPVEAVRDLGDGQYGVFVVDLLGQPRMKVVEVGLMDETYAEILSGVQMGDVVTTGAVETE